LRKTLLLGVLTAVLLMPGPLAPAAGDPPPLDPGLQEKVEVRLVILDVLVQDRSGNPVSGLRPEDFDVEVDDRPAQLVSVDETCGESAQKPKVVLAFDYQHLDEMQRGRILEDVRDAVERGRAAGADVMVAALTGSLRVEQPFTKDSQRVRGALAHMRNDASLFAGSFSHSSDEGFVRGLGSLFDVAGTFSGPKAVILYSGMADVPYEENFKKLAVQAAAARCSVYPFRVEGLSSGPRPLEGYRRQLRGDTRTAPPLESAPNLMADHKPTPKEDGEEVKFPPGCG